MKNKKKSQTITISGEVPSKKNSYRFSAHGLYKPKHITDFEKYVADCVLEQKVGFFTGELCIAICISTEASGDLDNKVTTLLDAIQDAGVFENDRQIVEISAEKLPLGKTAKAGAVIALYERNL